MTNHRPRRVFIIDDSKDMQALLKLILETTGCQVDCSLNGEDALNSLETMPVLPDVILLDSQMPVLDGRGFLKARRSLPRLRAVPVIMMSGEEESISGLHALPGETSGVLKKPFHLRAVIDAVEQSSSLQ